MRRGRVGPIPAWIPTVPPFVTPLLCYQITVTVFEQMFVDPASHTWYVAVPPPFWPVESV